MASLNQVTLIGNLGADPEVTEINGTPKCKLRIATSRKYKDKQGNQQEKTQWHTISVWGNQAQVCGQYLTKGRSVCVVGSIEYSKSEKDGVERWFTDIRAQNVTFLGSGQQSQGNQSQGQGNSAWSNRLPDQPQQGQGNNSGWSNQGQGNNNAWSNQGQGNNNGWSNQGQGQGGQNSAGNQGGNAVPF